MTEIYIEIVFTNGEVKRTVTNSTDTCNKIREDIMADKRFINIADTFYNTSQIFSIDITE